MAYYEVKQIPNFLLAAPTILISAYGISSYISFNKTRFLTIGFKSDPCKICVKVLAYR